MRKSKSSFGYLLLFGSLALIVAYWLVQCGTHVVFPSIERPILFYSNAKRDDLKLLIHSALRKAKNSIVLSIFSLSDPDIIQLLNYKAASGLQIEVFYDAKHSYQLARKLHPHIIQKPYEASSLMHQKIVIIDQAILFIGSANFTSMSLKYDRNLIAGIYSPEMADWLSLNYGCKQKMHTFHIKDRICHVFLLPDKKNVLLTQLLTYIETAKMSLKGSFFSLTHPALIKALTHSKERGIKLNLTLHRSANLALHSLLPIRIPKGYELMHQKCFLIDQKIVILGSLNWSRSGFKKNRECLLIFENLTPSETRSFKKRLAT